jgi:putative glutamine amidotransferase
MPLCLDDRGRWRRGRSYHYLDAAYAHAIERAGGIALYLPLPFSGVEAGPADARAEAAEAAARCVASIDGLLLPGGDDLPPEPGDAPLPEGLLDLTPAAQLRFDRELLRAAMARELPILGICYGMQLLARERGGQLEADLEYQRPDAAGHQLKQEAETHPLEIAADGRLAALLERTETEVNSLHHQAIRALGPAHRAVGWSPDGLIEAFENPDPGAPFEVGVQWHPEKLPNRDSDRLFSGFVQACRERREGPDAGAA